MTPTARTAPQPPSFNDDDVYIYNAETKQIVRTLGCKDSQVRDARHIGLRVMAGESWAKGMAAKSLGLWRAEPAQAFALTPADRALAADVAAIRKQPLETA